MDIIEFTLKDDMVGFDALSDLQNSMYEDPYYVRSINNLYADNFIKGFVLLENKEAKASALLFKPLLYSDNKPILFFGHFECESQDVGITLMEYVIKYCKNNYSNYRFIGPVNSGTWYNYKMPTNNFDVLFPGDIAGKLWYPKVMAELGFKEFCAYSTNLQLELKYTQNNVLQGFHIAYFDKEGIRKMLPEIYNITNEAFKTAPLFEEIPYERFRSKYSDDLEFLDTGLMPFVCDSNNEIVAFLVAYPSNNKNILVVKTIARKTGRVYAGIGKLLSNEIVNIAINRNYTKLYHAFMNQTNVSNVLSKNISGNCFKTYSVYSIDI